MRIGLISDIHIAPAGTPPERWHNDYRFPDADARLARALRRCLERGAEAIALLGDLAHLGDDESLDAALARAARSGCPIWVAAGNHDAVLHDTALAAAVARLAAPHVRMATESGALIAPGIRVAGLSISADGLDSVHAPAPPAIAAWEEDLVLWLTHYPMLSLVEATSAAGLRYAGDLENRAEVAEPIAARAAPTVAVHGHLHVRHASSRDSLLQISCAALIEPPFELTIVDVEPGDRQHVVRVRHEPVEAAGAAMSLPVLFPDNGAWSFSDGAWTAISRVFEG